MKTKKGFTLIELLLVVGVISILTSVIFFRVTEAKKKAEDAHMVAESAQVARAVYQYKEDKGFVPHSTISGGGGNREYLESDSKYTEVLGDLVPEYLPSVPHSPSGTGYTYIVSEDGKEAVFAADLNNARSGGGGSNKNSCSLVSNNSSNSSVTTFGSCSLVQIGTCVSSSTTACFTVNNTSTIVNLSGYDHIASTLNTYCDPKPNTLYPQYVNTFPSNLCQIGWKVCSMPSRSSPSVCVYEILPPTIQEEYACNYTTTTLEPAICGGDVETDYCECL